MTVAISYPGGLDLAVNAATAGPILGADIPARQGAVFLAAQRPVAAAAFSEPVAKTAPAALPKYAVIPTGDKAIAPAAERFMATRAGATEGRDPRCVPPGRGVPARGSDQGDRASRPLITPQQRAGRSITLRPASFCGQDRRHPVTLDRPVSCRATRRASRAMSIPASRVWNHVLRPVHDRGLRRVIHGHRCRLRRRDSDHLSYIRRALASLNDAGTSYRSATKCFASRRSNPARIRRTMSSGWPRITADVRTVPRATRPTTHPLSQTDV